MNKRQKKKYYKKRAEKFYRDNGCILGIDKGKAGADVTVVAFMNEVDKIIYKNLAVPKRMMEVNARKDESARLQFEIVRILERTIERINGMDFYFLLNPYRIENLGN